MFNIHCIKQLGSFEKINAFTFCTNTQCFEIENRSVDWEFLHTDSSAHIVIFTIYFKFIKKRKDYTQTFISYICKYVRRNVERNWGCFEEEDPDLAKTLLAPTALDGYDDKKQKHQKH